MPHQNYTTNHNKNPAGNYMFKVNYINARTRCEICSELTIKTSEQRHSSVSTVNFEQVNASWEWTEPNEAASKQSFHSCYSGTGARFVGSQIWAVFLLTLLNGVSLFILILFLGSNRKDGMNCLFILSTTRVFSLKNKGQKSWFFSQNPFDFSEYPFRCENKHIWEVIQFEAILELRSHSPQKPWLAQLPSSNYRKFAII